MPWGCVAARRARTQQIARRLGCDEQAVRNVTHNCNAAGRNMLHQGASRSGLRLPDLLYRSPRGFGQDCTTWTLELAARVCLPRDIVAAPISDESVRHAMQPGERRRCSRGMARSQRPRVATATCGSLRCLRAASVLAAFPAVFS
jgi:hypothetical protein